VIFVSKIPPMIAMALVVEDEEQDDKGGENAQIFLFEKERIK